MEIKQVAIFGAGAVGAYFIWGLAPVLGERLWVVAEGERAERLRRDGIRINGERHELTLRAPETAAGADLLLIATKYEAFCRALPDIAALAGPQTIVMSLLNGVESEKMLAEKLGTDRILPAMMKISSERRADGVHFVPEDTPGLFYGGWHRGERNELTEAVAALFARTQLHTQYCEDIWQEIWYKFALNISRNQPQAVIGCGIGAYKDSEHVAFLSRALRREAIEIAAAQGIDIANPGRGSGQSSPAAKRARYSTLQDLDAGRHTEVDMFAGAVMRLGEKYGVPTPYNTFIFHCIKALEEKNDGKFDYE